MSDSNSAVNPFDALAEEFVARHRRGENPSMSEYIARHPELADDIRDVRPQAVEATGPFTTPRHAAGWNDSATIASFARSAAAAWASSTKPSNCRWAATSP